MPFLGTIVNFFVVFICGILGSLLKKGVPKKVTDGIMSGIGVCVVYIGIDGILESAPTLVEGAFLSDGLVKFLIMIISMTLGTLIGELVDFDKWVNRFGEYLESKFAKEGDRGSFAKGFVSCSILFCVGAMAVNGSFQDALGNPDILIAKSIIDGISCFVMASTLGVGCAFSAFLLFIYQGIFTVIGMTVSEFLPASTISYMSVTGSLIIVLIGTNILGCTKVKTANMIPAIFLPALFAPIFSWALSLI